MWERFSFYGMQGILRLLPVLIGHRRWAGHGQVVATSLVGAYGGLVYLPTILGAWIADRLLGSERTLFYSAILIMLGHIGLAVLPGFSGVIVGLLCVGVGSGGLKANATAIVGTPYTTDHPRRDAGFSLFYPGINLGAFFGPLLTGIAQQKWGFHAGFALAAVGMAFGLIQYSFGRRRLPDESRVVHNPLPSSKYPMAIGVGVAAVVVILVLARTGVLAPGNLANLLVWVMLAASIAYFVIILAGVFASVWTKLGDRQPITPTTFALGNAVMGLAFLMFLPVANDAETPRRCGGWC